MIKVYMSILRNIKGVPLGDLGLEECMPPMGTYPLTYEAGMGIACVTLRLSPSKGRYVGHLQWYRMGKARAVWEKNIWGEDIGNGRHNLLVGQK